MDIIVHLGAHRCATTSFQYYLRKNGARFVTSGIGVWGPREMRGGLLSGVIAQPGPVPPARQLLRARGRLALRLAAAEKAGVTRLIVSDENMIGSTRHNLRERCLYPAAGARMARFGAALEGRVTRVVLSIRAQDAWWASAIAFGVGRGARVPQAAAVHQIAANPRGWRDVITDLSCALPGIPIHVLPHEAFASRPEQRLGAMLDGAPRPQTHARAWLNRAPDLAALRAALTDRGSDPALLPQGEGAWHPFDPEQRAMLREAYADDILWLRAGAGGLATLTEEPGPGEAGSTPQPTTETRGTEYVEENAGRVAQAGRR